ncbi:DUF4174 domain-containing protein [Sediminibacter sp. Hel_I_10]|uniref:DUF4174 domain-containing protein n=1 Tax=Sediminibacter sp. Hel_I_10 TaxID=1392490 RepID=UPI000AFB80C9|nr:DUF4174 domain-containing protein [Sediminibacter sp. Hel_I_10]
MNAQDLKKHQWEDRLILVFAKTSENLEFQKQLNELKAHEDGLKDRKLIVYRITPQSYATGFSKNTPWSQNATLFTDFMKSNDRFKILLIGLDGGIKLKASKIVAAGTLFETIDAMPMRRAELGDD